MTIEKQNNANQAAFERTRPYSLGEKLILLSLNALFFLFSPLVTLWVILEQRKTEMQWRRRKEAQQSFRDLLETCLEKS